MKNDGVNLSVEKEVLTIGGSDKRLFVYAKSNFNVQLYYKSIERMKWFLKGISEQPLNILLEDSQTFNVKICEAYL